MELLAYPQIPTNADFKPGRFSLAYSVPHSNRYSFMLCTFTWRAYANIMAGKHFATTGLETHAFPPKSMYYSSLFQISGSKGPGLSYMEVKGTPGDPVKRVFVSRFIFIVTFYFLFFFLTFSLKGKKLNRP